MFIYIWYLRLGDPDKSHRHLRNCSYTLLNMARNCRISFIPLYINITAEDWDIELDRIEIL